MLPNDFNSPSFRSLARPRTWLLAFACFLQGCYCCYMSAIILKKHHKTSIPFPSGPSEDHWYVNNHIPFRASRPRSLDWLLEPRCLWVGWSRGGLDTLQHTAVSREIPRSSSASHNLGTDHLLVAVLRLHTFLWFSLIFLSFLFSVFSSFFVSFKSYFLSSNQTIKLGRLYLRYERICVIMLCVFFYSLFRAAVLMWSLS